MKKVLSLFICICIFQMSHAQNEYITVWKPSNQSSIIDGVNQSSSEEIWFPGVGTNFNVSWEEIGFPTHHGTLTNVTAVKHFLINFGTPSNPNPSNAVYSVKISNGNGSYNSTKFPAATFISPSLSIPTITSYNGDRNKILEVSQWGNIAWQNWEASYANCTNLDVTAIDVPNLSNVTSSSLMFFQCTSLIGNPSFNNWNTSPITNMSHMFASAGDFNQPIGNWDTSNVTDMTWMFHYLSKFNQNVENWNVSKVTKMEHMFHRCYNFNQPLVNWDTSKVTNMKSILEETTNFNQNIGSWNFSAIEFAMDMIKDSGIDCENYNSTLIGWANNSVTPTAINLGSVSPLQYSSTAASTARNILVNTKSWTMTGDTFSSECLPRLGTSETETIEKGFIYPNPSTDFIYIRNIKNISSYKILDISGRIIINKKDFQDQKIDVSTLNKGNYVLHINTKEKNHAFKFIKN